MSARTAAVSWCRGRAARRRRDDRIPRHGSPPFRVPTAGQDRRVRGRAGGRRGRADRRRRRCSSAAAPPGSPARSAWRSCWRTTRRPPSSSARCRSRCWRRAARPAPTCCPARSSNPAALRELLPGEVSTGLPGCYGEVTTRGRLLHAPGLRACASPPRRRSTTRATASSRSRGWAGIWPSRPRSSGVMVLPETDAQRLLVARRRRAAACAPATRAAAARAGAAGDFEPGAEVHAQATVLAEGDAGPPDRRRCATTSASRATIPQVVRARASRRSGGSRSRSTASSTRWAGRSALQRQVARGRRLASSTRWATTWCRLGLVVGLDYRGRQALAARHAAAVQDPPVRARACSRAASGSPGAPRRSPRAASWSLPRSLSRAGRRAGRRQRRLRQRARS